LQKVKPPPTLYDGKLAVTGLTLIPVAKSITLMNKGFIKWEDRGDLN
jgi:hypothetical protein